MIPAHAIIPTARSAPVSPLTGAADVIVERRWPAYELAERWRTESGIDATEELDGHDEILRYRCRTTGLSFFWPPEVAGSASFYRQLQHFTWYYAKDRWEYQPALAALQGCTSVLEVGCGSGEFLDRAGAAGIAIQGIEMNPDAVGKARARGLTCERRDLFELARTCPGTQEAVCSFQVLEHVTDPRRFIESCIRLLRPDGLLIFSVPNAKSWIRHKDFLFDLPPHHMLGWDQRVFRSLESLFALTLDQIRFEPLPESQIENYLSAQRERFNQPVMRRMLFNRLSMPLLSGLLRASILPLGGQSMLAIFKVNKNG